MELKCEILTVTKKLKQILKYFNVKKKTELFNLLCDLDLLIPHIDVDTIIVTIAPFYNIEN